MHWVTLFFVSAAALLAGCASNAPIVLTAMGSFHVGRCEVTSSGKHGARHEVIDLPKIGIRGNSHMIMMDKNSDQVAQVIQDWLAKQGLYR